ncbi:hypothetical protein BASA81_000089 [Batrachochytrium salamandrivorans]|nr:hypothetical protein BASA81_000089 [Batrachochytrium salamandrivorans]
MGNALPAKFAQEPTKGELSAYPATGGEFWTDRPDGESVVRYSDSGLASKQHTPAMTVVELLQLAVKQRPTKLALSQEDPKLIGLDSVTGLPPKPLSPSQMLTWTWSEYHNDVRKCAKALMQLGFQQHDSCTIFGFNSPEWLIGALGGIFAGGKACGVYPTDTAQQFQFKCEHSHSSVVLVESQRHIQLIVPVIKHLPYLKAVVVWTGEQPDTTLEHVRLLSWRGFLSLAENVGNEPLDGRIAQIKPGHCCALVYTSGTTGDPKAVMVSHDNIVFEARVVMSDGARAVGARTTDEERLLSYLPISHIAGFMIDIACPIVITALRPGYCTVHFARSYDLKTGTLADRLRMVRPTVFLGVPRVWEKVAEKLKQVGAKLTGPKKAIGAWAKRQGLEHQTNLQVGGSGKKPMALYIADKVILQKVKAALGLDQMKFAFAGAAPMTVDTLEYFAQLGININEAYGMSECTAVTTWSTNEVHVWGTVGYALSGMEVRVFKLGTKQECPRAPVGLKNIPEACMGELCFRGRHVMMGYMANPVLGEAHVLEIKRKNHEAIDSEGWLHSGDMAVKTLQGMVKITGRYKELLITAGGENVAPVPIEDEIKKQCMGLVSNVQLIGDKRKFLSCLITLTCQGSTGERAGTTELLKDFYAGKFPGLKTIPQAVESIEFLQFLEQCFAQVNKTVPNNASKVTKFTILPLDFSVETGELTATMKLKRSVVEQKYSTAIEYIYDSAEDASNGSMFVPCKF